MPNPVREDGKVVVQFRHTGNAPILKQQKYKVPADARFSTLATLLRSHLRLSADEPLVRRNSTQNACAPHRSARARTFAFACASQFLYCNSAFAPPPDELVSDVATCFHVDGVLLLNYCTTPAWG